MKTNNSELEQGRFESLKKVTPLSKYLALILFIILPFFGAWIGYEYAPEKIITVTKVEIVNEKPVVKNIVFNTESGAQISFPYMWSIDEVDASETSNETHRIKDEAGDLIMSLSYTETLADFSMAAPLENRTTLKEALVYELINIEEIQLGGFAGYSGYSVNESLDSVVRQVWIEREGEIFMFQYDPKDESKVSEILNNLKL